jgi:hydroxyethylthiazole kinase-like uncharacterized protein yjeF
VIVLSPSTMRKADLTAIEKFNIPGMVLMENAGLHVAQAVKEVFIKQKKYSDKCVAIICGKGNNGGDGFVAARHLANDGYSVDVFVLAKENEIKGDALSNLEIIKKMDIPIKTVTTSEDMAMMEMKCKCVSVIVDAIFGTGIKGEIHGIAQEAIRIINNSKSYIIAVDIPSGISGQTGKVLGVATKANETVTMAALKMGLVLYPGASYAGKIHVVDIGMPKKVLCDLQPEGFLTDREEVISLFKPYPPYAHKGNFGRVFIIAGSRGMAGAAALAAKAAVHCGAGLVTLGIPKSLNDIIQVKVTEAMTAPLPETADGTLSLDCLEQALAFSVKCDAVALGPGLSQHEETKRFVKNFVMECPVPMVIDADALNALAESPDVFTKTSAPVLITPHPGEMARLLKVASSDIEQDRIAAVKRGVSMWGCTVLLKGARSLIGHTDGRLWINPTGNPGMATGGSGDVLTGMTAALIARAMATHEAAVAGAYIHGMAGDLAADEMGQISLAAGDIIRFLPRAFCKIGGSM